MKKPLFALALLIASAAASAQMSPVGLWKTIDDESKKEKSLVRITEGGGVISGKIEKLLDPDVKAGETCDKCTDDRKDKPILGLTILRNLKQGTEDKTVWEGGDILDPNNGKIYRAQLKPMAEGKQLRLRGYLGPFFRTQTWIRVE
jgi:uncharacterized protein (DUF2147 family)